MSSASKYKLQEITLFAIGLFFFISSCHKVPITGRKQLNLLPEDELIDMARHQYDSLMQVWPQVKTGSDYADLHTVGRKISRAVETYLKNNGYEKLSAEFSWEYHLVKIDTIANAWCMPGGKIAFYTGILPITKNKSGMAVVMGHEIAHAVARHGNERLSQALALQMGGIALSVALQTRAAETQRLFMGAYGLGVQVGLVLPFSRKHELEADRMGLIFMAMAGYDPRIAVSFWKRMAKMGKGGIPKELTFLSTHPSYEERIAAIENDYLPEALKYYSGK